MSEITGWLSLKNGDTYFSLYFPTQGWLAAEMVQYLDEILTAPTRETAILKLLGFTLGITTESPRRRAGHWVLVDLDEHLMETNSELIRLAIDQAPPPENSPYTRLGLRRIHEVLDRFDFTVKLYK